MTQITLENRFASGKQAASLREILPPESVLLCRFAQESRLPACGKSCHPKVFCIVALRRKAGCQPAGNLATRKCFALSLCAGKQAASLREIPPTGSFMFYRKNYAEISLLPTSLLSPMLNRGLAARFPDLGTPFFICSPPPIFQQKICKIPARVLYYILL